MAIVPAAKKDIRSTLGAGVNIKGYTSSNPYTCPDDGYVVLNMSGTAPLTGAVVINGMNSMGAYAENQYRVWAAFVKKGTKLYCIQMDSSSYLTAIYYKLA